MGTVSLCLKTKTHTIPIKTGYCARGQLLQSDEYQFNMNLHAALCTELKPNFVLRTARRAVLKFVPDALTKCCIRGGDTAPLPPFYSM
jgi:hypothetical protein